MKRISLLVGGLVVLAMLATSAFTHPLASRNGVVTSYDPGKSLTIHSGAMDMTYALRGDTFANVNGIGTGARVTVWAECFGGSNSANGALAALAPSTANGNAAVHPSGHIANSNTCIAVFILVRAAASSGTGAAGTGTATPAATASPAVTATPTP